MTVTRAEVGIPAGRRSALVRRLYEEFPQVPAGFVADAVLQAWRDPMPVERRGAATGASVEEAAERDARQRLLDWRRRAERAIGRVGATHGPAGAAAWWRRSASTISAWPEVLIV